MGDDSHEGFSLVLRGDGHTDSLVSFICSPGPLGKLIYTCFPGLPVEG